jgi:uncharacterized membrane protein YoaT (DUF817 family)
VKNRKSIDHEKGHRSYSEHLHSVCRSCKPALALPGLLLACYLAVSILMLSQWHSPRDLIYYGVAFVLGPVFEAATVHFGAWQYSEPLYLIPIWLPLLWGIMAVFLKKVCEIFAGLVGAKGSRHAK